jgi:hypothetical protein
MQQHLRQFSLGEVIPQDELLPHIGGLFELFPADKWLPALWEVMQAYSTPRYKTREKMLQDENMQIFIHFIDMFGDLYET